MRGMGLLRRGDLALAGDGGRFAPHTHSAPDTTVGADDLHVAIRDIMLQHPAVLIQIRDHPSGIILDTLSVHSEARGSGVGRTTLAAIHAVADAAGKDIYLTPDGVFGSDPRRLTRFYIRHGYVPHRGGDPDEQMVRRCGG